MNAKNIKTIKQRFAAMDITHLFEKNIALEDSVICKTTDNNSNTAENDSDDWNITKITALMKLFYHEIISSVSKIMHINVNNNT